MARRAITAVVVGAVLLGVAGAAWFLPPAPNIPIPPAQAVKPSAGAPAEYVGSDSCAECHEGAFKAWQSSHHNQAMQIADATTVLGDFGDALFEHFGIPSTFFKRDDRFFVRTEGSDGRPGEFEVKYTFGVAPLQQYLVEFPGGRLQALSIAWDSRAAAEGGQRWFHLYPHERVDHTDRLHWTGRYQNWNLMCAECHSTNLRKGYDAATDTYRTTYSEISVGCEACHGPGSRHVEWAERAEQSAEHATDNGLSVRLRSDWATAWRLPDEGARFPERAEPADPAVSGVCAACHARRSAIAEGGVPGRPLEETHRPAMLTEPNYFTDGQQREEVYEWGSFLQSRMHQRGVTCSDCHEPHSSKVRFEGNTLCARCHSPTIFDTPRHHFHEMGTQSAACVSCHMPARGYMVVDPRRDHSLRVPRPDLTRRLGTTDACTMCHADRVPEWAAAAMDGWYGKAWRERKEWGSALHAGATQGMNGLRPLIELARDDETPAIVRATAASVAQGDASAEGVRAGMALLTHQEASVRIEALGLVEALDPAARAAACAPLLKDKVRGVRVAAVRALADARDHLPSADAAAAFDAAVEECLASLRLNADWPVENVNLGNFMLALGRSDEAIAAYRRAIAMDERFAGAYVNLADAFRTLGRDEEGEAALRDGLSAVPDAADLRHALGLLLVRRGEMGAAMEELSRSAALAPGNARYAHVYAVGLHSAGRVDEALTVLREADGRSPFNMDILGTLISIHRERGGPGDKAAALGYARRLEQVMPGDPEIQGLIRILDSEP